MTKMAWARGVVMMTALAGVASPAAAQKILTAVQSEQYPGTATETKVGNVAGQQLSATLGGVDTRALTDFGVNKVYASGNAQYVQYATSSWVDSYTVGGAAGSTVRVSFIFAIDGIANYPSTTEATFNYTVAALRGDGWTLSGRDYSGTSWSSPFANGTDYEAPVLTQTLAGRVTQTDLRNVATAGFWNYTNAGEQAGSFNSHVTYVAAGDYFAVESPANGANGGPGFETRYYATGFRNFRNGAPITPLILYATNAQTQPQGVIRANLVANYSLIGSVSLCPGGSDGCLAGQYPGSSLSLSFDLLAGSTFSLASTLFADDVTDGSVNFFNTAKVTGVTVSPGASLTSTSGALALRPDGSFGYPAATGAVPEPSSWAMMLGGFGLLGAGMRRRRRTVALA